MEESPKERAREILKVTGSKIVSVWFQEKFILLLEKDYQIKSDYQKQVLTELKK